MSVRRLAAVPDQPVRAVAYVRVSALMGRSGDAFHSPGLQMQAMQRLADARGMTIVETVQDIDTTGRSFDRDGIRRVMTMARNRDADAVALYDLSRLGRNTRESLRHIAELRELGVSVVSSTEQIDDSPEGQFMLGQFLGMAQLYSDQIGRRWQQVIARRAEQGRWHGSNPPMGYRLRAREDGGGLEVDPLIGPLIVEAFEGYAAGLMVSRLARQVGDRRGRVLAVTALKAALRNPVYVGRIRAGGRVLDGLHEPLVDVVTWERVQTRLERDARTPSRRLAISHSLVGLVFCDECGMHLQLHVEPARPARGQVEAVARLQCRRRMDGGEVACRGPGVPRQADVEAVVLAQLSERVELYRTDGTERAARQARRARAGVDVGRLQRELTASEAALSRLTVDLARRDITAQAYSLAAAELEASTAALRVRLDEVSAVAQAPSGRGSDAATSMLLRLWPASLVDERNRLLRGLIAQVRVRRAVSYREPMADRVEVVWP